KMDQAVKTAGEGPLMQILPYHHKKVGIVSTGSEVSKGLIQDSFSPILKGKLSAFDTDILDVVYPGDDPDAIRDAIFAFVEQGCDMVLCTGGMSVDPDDRTPGAIKSTGAKIITYGAPVLPGAMFLLSYLDGKPVCGLPGCVMYAKRTIFDLMLPRLMADDTITAEEIARLGVGGLCRLCDVCSYPNCGFGK
ncbi:MAG: molybdopterin-binding protein, partial [Lachnospiraceae bacterium]|nr:molybdopterin-binding protein [Lachnospiraceae bacterium]